MATEVLGLRRLYGAPSFHFEGLEQVEHSFRFDETFSVTVRIGPKPLYGFIERTGNAFYEPGGRPVEMKVDFHPQASEELTGFRSYTEITITFQTEIDDPLKEKFQAGGDAKVDHEVMTLIQPRKQALQEIADIVAGIIGLRVHRQLVFRLLNEHTIAFRPNEQVKGDVTSGWVEMLDDIRVRTGGEEKVKATIEVSGKLSKDDREYARNILFWLMRAWSEEDAINVFLALFVPLELVLDSVSVPTNPSRERIAEFRSALCPTLPDFVPDLDLLATAIARPSLNDRFNEYARGLAFKDWEEDVEAFKAFNRDRNRLLHRGHDRIRLSVQLEENEIRRMQDLVERYVSGRLFGDENIYPSSFRITRWPPVNQ
jgi:hypothetical protein